MNFASLPAWPARGLLVAALLLITMLALTPQDYLPLEDINDKLQHILAFIVLAWLTDQAFPKRPWSWRKFIPLLIYGLILEVLQGFTPGRVTSFLDLGADAIGLLLYPLLLSLASKFNSSRESHASKSP